MGRKYFYHYTTKEGARGIEKKGQISKANFAAFGAGKLCVHAFCVPASSTPPLPASSLIASPRPPPPHNTHPTGVYGTGLPPSTSDKKLLTNNYGAPSKDRKPHVSHVIAIPLRNLPDVKQVGEAYGRDVLLHPNKPIDLDKACGDGECRLIKRR